MNLQFERIQSASHRCLKVLLPLYMESFPPEERRDSNDLLRMLNVPEMYFSVILSDEQEVGFVIFWKFERFLYVEHLAVCADQRRKGIGKWVLEQLQNTGNPVLLEVEIPYDDASTKRVAFYNRSGFSALPVYYHQPPYRVGESLVPMMLFSDRTEWDPEVLNSSIELFQYRVYGAKEMRK